MNTHEVLDQIDSALDDWEVGPDAMRCNAPSDVTAGRPVVRHGDGFVTAVITIDVSGYVAAMERWIADSSRIWRSFPLPWSGPTTIRVRRTRRRFTEPRPLCIDGHAYHRRTRNRRKRR